MLLTSTQWRASDWAETVWWHWRRITVAYRVHWLLHLPAFIPNVSYHYHVAKHFCKCFSMQNTVWRQAIVICIDKTFAKHFQKCFISHVTMALVFHSINSCNVMNFKDKIRFTPLVWSKADSRHIFCSSTGIAGTTVLSDPPSPPSSPSAVAAASVIAAPYIA